MSDRPTAAELAEAVRGFLDEEVQPALQGGRLRFRALVATNALSILQRDLALGPGLLREEEVLLSALLDLPAAQGAQALNLELCRRLRRGEIPQGTRAALLRIAAMKLSIASPKYLKGGPR